MRKVFCLLQFTVLPAHAEEIEVTVLSASTPTELDSCATPSRSNWKCRQSLLQEAGGLHMLRLGHLTEELSGNKHMPVHSQWIQSPHNSLGIVPSASNGSTASNVESAERAMPVQPGRSFVRTPFQGFNGTDLGPVSVQAINGSAGFSRLDLNTSTDAGQDRTTESPITIILVLLVATLLFCIVALGSKIYNSPKEDESLENFAARQTAGRLSAQQAAQQALLQRQGSSSSSPANFGPRRPNPAAPGYPTLGSATALNQSKAMLPVSSPQLTSSSTPTMPKMPPINLKALRHLCPGLVVPDSTECILAVPTLRTAGMPAQRSVNFDVLDLSGKPVIRTEVSAPSANRGPVSTTIEPVPIVIMRAASNQQMASPLAYCRIDKEPQGRQSCFFYNAQDELFAHLAKDPFRNCYVVIGGPSGVQMTIEGNFSEHAVTVKSEHREIQADTEPARQSLDAEGFALQGGYYQVRVVSNVDVGLMLCSLICIDHMETDWPKSSLPNTA